LELKVVNLVVAEVMSLEHSRKCHQFSSLQLAAWVLQLRLLLVDSMVAEQLADLQGLRAQEGEQVISDWELQSHQELLSPVAEAVVVQALALEEVLAVA
jgi:hypothetical protein